MIGRSLASTLCLLLLFSLLPTAAGAADPYKARAQELIDAGRGAAAVEILEPILKKNPKDAEALFLRSTARFLEGDSLRGRWDLEQSLELDPLQRQGWLNLGALNLAEGKYDGALTAFEQARGLDPDNVDVELNIGAVLLFQGKLEPASAHFQRYLQGAPDIAEPFYLVASNYAISGYASLAVEHLRQAVAREERFRLKARTDPAFGTLSNHPALQRFLARDDYRPPAGAHRASRDFPVAYETTDARLVGAVVDTLRQQQWNFDARIEMTPNWTLIWGDVRIKVGPADQGRIGKVELTAPPERFTPDRWRQLSQSLLDGVAAQLR
jgi:tetratricopeptide (TPR) repeat protein